VDSKVSEGEPETAFGIAWHRFGVLSFRVAARRGGGGSPMP